MSGIWDFPGLDPDTFYASAFYVHVTQQTLETPSLAGEPKRTNQVHRHFLDRLADCFAWTKKPGETAEHVTAIALVEDDLEDQESSGNTSTILIAKNILHPPQEENFAESFFLWLNRPSPSDAEDLKFWGFLAHTQADRLTYYVTQIVDASRRVDQTTHLAVVEQGPILESAARGLSVRFEDNQWNLIKAVVRLCVDCHRRRELPGTKLIHELQMCSEHAHFARTDSFFDSLCRTSEHRRQHALRESFLPALHSDLVDEKTPQDELLEGIEHLGRLYSSFKYFIKFRDSTDRKYRHKIIATDAVKWDGQAVVKKIEGWMDLVPNMEEASQAVTASISRHDDQGSVHCEMQLLCHSIKNFLPLPDYIGCSKKACALCQHVLVSCGIHVNAQYTFIYPRWSLPQVDFGAYTRQIAAGLMSANTSLLSVMHTSVSSREPPNRDYGIMHTSARITRRHSFAGERTTISNHLNEGVYCYTIRDSIRHHSASHQSLNEVGSVPALHLPTGNNAKPRMVRISLYRVAENDRDFKRTPMPGKPFKSKDEYVYDAVTLKDRLDFEKLLHKKHELYKHYWCQASIYDYSAEERWVVLFRLSDSTDFQENSCFQDVLAESRRKQPGWPRVDKTEDRRSGWPRLPRGDMFIFSHSDDDGVLDQEMDIVGLLEWLHVWWDSMSPTTKRVFEKAAGENWERAVDLSNGILPFDRHLSRLPHLHMSVANSTI